MEVDQRSAITLFFSFFGDIVGSSDRTSGESMRKTAKRTAQRVIVVVEVVTKKNREKHSATITKAHCKTTQSSSKQREKVKEVKQ